MIAGGTNRNFIVAHYDWLALGVAVIALAAAGVFAVGSFGDDPDECAADAAAR